MRILLIIAAVVAVISALSSIFIVEQRRQALVLQFGEAQRVVKEPGLHFKMPYIQNVLIYDSRVLDLDAKPNEVIDKDQKPLIIDAFVKYQIEDPLLYYQSVQSEVRGNQRLNTFLDASLREVMGSTSIGTLLTEERAIVMETISQNVREKAKNIGLKVVDVRIMRADFPEENSNRIFERMKTEREEEAKQFRAEGAEKAQLITATADKERTIILAEAERDSQILRGKGDATASRIFAEAFSRDPSFFSFYRSMQAYRKSMAREDTRMVLSPDSDFMKYFENMRGQ